MARLTNVVTLGCTVLLWYASSAVCTSCGKAALNHLMPRAGSCALSLTTMQFVVSAAATLVACAVLGRRPPSALRETALVSLAYTLGFLLLNCSLGRLAASFSETVRGLEPLSSFILVRIFAARGGALSLGMGCALMAVLLGAAIAVWAQPAFDVNGLLLGLLANCAFSSRGLLVTLLQDAAKRNAQKDEARRLQGGAGGDALSSDAAASRDAGRIDPIGLFAAQHVLGLLLLGPAAFATEGDRCVHALHGHPAASRMALFSSLGFLAYNFLSLVVLLLMDAVSHSVLNTTRRAATIIAAAAVFQTPVGPSSACGIVLIIGGAVAYAIASHRAASSARPQTSSAGDGGGVVGVATESSAHNESSDTEAPSAGEDDSLLTRESARERSHQARSRT